MEREGVVKERLLQIVSVAIHVAISRRVSRFKLQLIARRQEGAGGRRMTDSHR